MPSFLLLIFLSFVTLSGCVLSVADSVNRNPSEDLNRIEYHSELDAPESKALYYYGVARLQLASGDLSAAIEAMRYAVSIDNESSYLHTFLVELSLRGEDYQTALIAAERLNQLVPDNPETLWSLGTINFRLGRYQHAATYFKQLLELFPATEKAYIHLALVYAKLADFAAAETILNQLIEVNPSNLIGRMALVRIYLEGGQTADAENVLRAILTEHPHYEPAVVDLATLLNDRNDFPAALDLLRGAIASSEESATLRRKLVDLYLIRNLYDDARQELKLLLAADPLDLDVQRKIGLLELEAENFTAAAAAFETILAVNPDLDEIRYYYGSALERDSRYSEALVAFSLIPDNSRLYADALYHRGYLYRMLQQDDAAVKVFFELIELPEARADVYSALASVYEGRMDYPAALTVLNQGVARFTESVDLLYHKGIILERMEEREQARSVMQQLLSLDPKHADALNYLAYSYAEAGIHLPEALRMAREAYELNPAAHIADTIGWIYFKMGRYDEALSEIEGVYLELPDDQTVIEHLADICLAVGDTLRARDLYQIIIERFPAESERIRHKLKLLH